MLAGHAVGIVAGQEERGAGHMAADDSDGMTGQHVLVDAGIAQQSVIT